MTCEHCRWWNHQRNTYGLCQRYPRTEDKFANQWCGEFSERIEKVYEDGGSDVIKEEPK